ncbi:hypothetical protein [Sorangium sp. So ce233]|uniref:hypothetical protein n=1 Tax=Sorangium sp. So ce233 TaxID=3133290 RepID=UPI003F619A98
MEIDRRAYEGPYRDETAPRTGRLAQRDPQEKGREDDVKRIEQRVRGERKEQTSHEEQRDAEQVEKGIGAERQAPRREGGRRDTTIAAREAERDDNEDRDVRQRLISITSVTSPVPG